MSENIKSLAVIVNPILLGIIGVMMVLMYTSMDEDIKSKVSNDVIIQYMKLQEEQWKNQQRVNESLTVRLTKFESSYLYMNERSSKKKRIINYMDLGSFICKYDYSLITIFDNP